MKNIEETDDMKKRLEFGKGLWVDHLIRKGSFGVDVNLLADRGVGSAKHRRLRKQMRRMNLGKYNPIIRGI